MTRRTPRVRAVVVLATALLATAALIASPPPAAGSDGPCPGTTGVTVVVDYQALGGGIVVRCAHGSPDTGFKALQAAGFSIGEVRNVPGFLCRIDGLPGPAQEACINTPPASAFWSYWSASRGGTWKNNQEGGKTRKPPVGSVEGWSFSDDGTPGAASPPGIDPPAKPATPKPTAKPTPKPTAKPTPTPTARPTAKPETPTPTADPTPGPTLEPAASAPPDPSATPVPSAGPTGSAADASAAVTLPPAGPSDGGSSRPPSPADVALGGTGPGSDAGSPTAGAAPPVGTLVGIGLLVLVVCGALLARSRRSVGGDPS